MNKKILASIFLAALVLTISALPFVTLAQDDGGGSAGGDTLSTMAARVEVVAIDIATPIVVIGWIITGILWLTAAGAPDKLGTAKKAVFACVIGTIIVALAITSDAIMGVIKDALNIGA